MMNTLCTPLRTNGAPQTTRSPGRGRCWGLPCTLVLTMVTALGGGRDAAGQITPLSQDRHVAASSTCNTGCTPASQTFSAAGFGVFTMTAAADSTGNPSSTVYGHGRAIQTSTISSNTISGTVQASRDTRNGSASGDSTCSVTFSITQACSFSFSSTWNPPAGSPIPTTTFTLSGPFGQAFSVTPNTGGGPFTASGLLSAGTYTFVGSAFVSGGGGSGMFFSTGANFTLSLTGLAMPGVVAGPIRNPANCHRYLMLSNSGWLEAEAKAIQLGGHLITINDAAEQHWAFTTFMNAGPEYKWIGLNSRAHPGTATFDWSSGQTPAYANWLSGPSAGAGDFVLYLSQNTPFAGRWIQSDNSYQLNIVGGLVEVEGCGCDWNLDGVLNSADFFVFLTDFFGGSADFNCTNTTTSQDFFDFLACFFTECP